ncbi:MAG: hypothetical protein GC150_00200 [Rhizobiales bacterium]|nr:hypothetical protein [Hyphomicrobiales bacterium]
MPSHTATTNDFFAPMMHLASVHMDTMATVSEAAVRTASEMTDTMFRFAEEALATGGTARSSMTSFAKGRPVGAEPGQRVKRAATSAASSLSASRPASRAGRSWYRAPARTPLETWAETFGYSTDMTRAWGDAASVAQVWSNCMAPVAAAANAMNGQGSQASKSALNAFGMPNWLTDAMKRGTAPWSEMWTTGRPRAASYEAFAPNAEAARLFSDWLEAASKGMMTAWPTTTTIDVTPAATPSAPATRTKAAAPTKATAKTTRKPAPRTTARTAAKRPASRTTRKH